MSDLLRDALIGADPLDPRWTWLGGAAERLREHAPADEDPGAMYECADVLDVLHVAIREALAIEPEYEWRACVADRFVDSDLIDSGDRSEPCGSREAAQACLADLVDTEPPYDEAWIERRVAVKAGPWERVDT